MTLDHPLAMESTFASMLAEWREVLGEVKGARRQRAETLVTAWESGLAAMAAEQNELRLAGRWLSGPADLLGVIGRSRREVCHCAVLAWLLDPGAPHGLGVAFLSRFMAASGCEPEEPHALAAVVTQTEVARTHSRADLVVWAPRFTIVVEAKVDAEERPAQCDDLYRDFEAEPRPSFVFLTPRGRTPTTASAEAAVAFRPLSFREVRGLLREALAATPQALDSPGAAAVHTYLQTLKVEFP